MGVTGYCFASNSPGKMPNKSNTSRNMIQTVKAPVYLDIITTYEVRTCEATLSCGKCSEGQLVGTGINCGNGAIMHTCTHCQRELAVEGNEYPYTFTERVPIKTLTIENPAPDPLAPAPKLSSVQLQQLPVTERAELLSTSSDVEYIEHFRAVYEAILYAPSSTLIRNVLFDLAVEGAKQRTSLLSASKVDTPLDTSVVVMASLLTTTTRPEVIEEIRSQTHYRLNRLPEIRKALFDNALQMAQARAELITS
jgi:hypothetical protein